MKLNLNHFFQLNSFYSDENLYIEKRFDILKKITFFKKIEIVKIQIFLIAFLLKVICIAFFSSSVFENNYHIPNAWFKTLSFIFLPFSDYQAANSLFTFTSNTTLFYIDFAHALLYVLLFSLWNFQLITIVQIKSILKKFGNDSDFKKLFNITLIRLIFFTWNIFPFFKTYNTEMKSFAICNIPKKKKR